MAESTDTNTVLFVAALKNAHAMEKEAQQLISRQLDRLEHYPKLSDRLRQHLSETNIQMTRLDDVMSDEVLKDSFASFAFENFEIAAYKSLFTIGEVVGQSTVLKALQPSLQEEQSMAAWLDENLADVTRTYMQLRTAKGVDASH